MGKPGCGGHSADQGAGGRVRPAACDCGRGFARLRALGGDPGGSGQPIPVMSPVIFSPAARTEFFEAADWYEAHGPGLGARFYSDVDALVSRVAECPHQFPRIRQEIRRAVHVIACFHASRNPRRWHERA
ncbi:Plasmid stabilization system protein, RelE/ParE family (modular protein) [Magnetospirillum sp. SS-4]|nr:Plasmid stabilization system protein, RelE/ParE family (modular protein) [Magnetospirillum sp. SS-4]